MRCPVPLRTCRPPAPLDQCKRWRQPAHPEAARTAFAGARWRRWLGEPRASGGADRLRLAEGDELPDAAVHRAECLPRVVEEEPVRRKVPAEAKRDDEQTNSDERVDDDGSHSRFRWGRERRLTRRCDHGQEYRASHFRFASRLRRRRDARARRAGASGCQRRAEPRPRSRTRRSL
jgi:hypothetical protein